MPPDRIIPSNEEPKQFSIFLLGILFSGSPLSAGLERAKITIREILGIAASQLRPIDSRKNLQRYN